MVKIYEILTFDEHEHLQTSFQQLLKKEGGARAAWEYPFAVAGVNITFMLMQMLDLDACKIDSLYIHTWVVILKSLSLFYATLPTELADPKLLFSFLHF